MSEGVISESDRKRTLYVGGVAENVTEDILRAAFIAFGEIKDVQIPIENSTGTLFFFVFVAFENVGRLTRNRFLHDNQKQTGKNRGFGFVQFEEIEDAEDAMDNMHNAELFNRVITVNVAKAQSIKLGYHRPVWADADNFYSKLKEDGADTGTDAVLSSKQAE